MIFIALAAEGVYLVIKASLFIFKVLLFGLSSKDLSQNLTVLISFLMTEVEYPLFSRLFLCFSLKA